MARARSAGPVAPGAADLGQPNRRVDHRLRRFSGCQPVLLLVDEAGRAPIPTLADHATTVVGRGISLWLAVQSLSQLEATYGKARAQVIRDNMDSQISYRPTDFATAEYLEKRLGKV